MIKPSVKSQERSCGNQIQSDGRIETTQGLNKMLFIKRLLEKASSSWDYCLRPQLPPDSYLIHKLLIWFSPGKTYICARPPCQTDNMNIM